MGGGGGIATPPPPPPCYPYSQLQRQRYVPGRHTTTNLLYYLQMVENAMDAHTNSVEKCRQHPYKIVVKHVDGLCC